MDNIPKYTTTNSELYKQNLTENFLPANAEKRYSNSVVLEKMSNQVVGKMVKVTRGSM